MLIRNVGTSIANDAPPHSGTRRWFCQSQQEPKI